MPLDFIITKNTRATEEPPGAPSREDGSLFDFGMRYGGGWLYCWADDVCILAGALCGDVEAYMAATEQERLVMRLRASIGFQTKRQAAINMQAMSSGRWDKCTPGEQAVLNGRRDTQPHGWNADLFDGTDWWLCPVALIVLATGYAPYSDVPLPMTSGDNLFIVDAVVEEAWLDDLADLGVIALFSRTV